MSDGAGVVTAVGPGVTEFAVGDNVVSTFFPDWHGGEATVELLRAVPGDRADGYAREAVTAPATSFTRAPKGYSHAEAATLTCAGLTAWRALVVNGNLKAGDVVLTQGTGGVSIFALQFAKAAGATVISTTSSADKAARLKALGADHVINYKDDADWGRTAKKLTGGRGVDHVVEIGGCRHDRTIDAREQARRPYLVDRGAGRLCRPHQHGPADEHADPAHRDHGRGAPASAGHDPRHRRQRDQAGA